MAPFDVWYAGRCGSADFDELAEMFTIDPLPALRISGIAYLAAHTEPINAIRRIWANVSLSVSSTWLSLPLPTSSDAMALFTSVVTQPKRSTVAATAPATCSSTPLSARTYIARPPASLTAASTALPASSDRPVNATAAPSAANISTIPWPIPRVPPVTSATFPSSRMFLRSRRETTPCSFSVRRQLGRRNRRPGREQHR